MRLLAEDAIYAVTGIVVYVVLKLALYAAGWHIGWWIVVPLVPLCAVSVWAVEKAA